MRSGGVRKPRHKVFWVYRWQLLKSSHKIPSSAEFLTPLQVAGIFQVKEMTVRLWLRRRLLRGVRIGHSWRVPRESIEEFKKGT